MSEKIQLQIRIQEVNETAFHLKPLPDNMAEPILGENLNIGFNFNMRINEEKERLVFISKVFYSLSNQQEPHLQLQSEIHFILNPLSGILQKQSNNELGIKDQVMLTLISTCIGTIRGMLAINTKGTVWAKYPLPLLNPEHILKHFMKKNE